MLPAKRTIATPVESEIVIMEINIAKVINLA